MPQPQHNWAALTINPLIAEQLNYDRNAEHADLNLRLPCLNNGQCATYTRFTEAITNDDTKVFFLNGLGGTGKTYLHNTICAKLRSKGQIILCVSSSGISALLMCGGRTAHSMFKIPIDTLGEGSVCGISKNSQCAELLHATKAIIWDEIGAQHCYAVEAIDHTIQDICRNNCPSDGKIALLSGDFLQTLPVVAKGSREDIINAMIQHSYLRDNIEVLSLTENMRLQQWDVNVYEFVQWLLDVGHGQNMVGNRKEVDLLPGMRVEDVETLINTIYPAIDTTPPPPPEYFMNHMILALRNTDVEGLNQIILECMTGEVRQYVSADEVLHEPGADPHESNHIPVEVLRSQNNSSLPPGELNLKVGCPIILLRNLLPSTGLCNGT